MPQSLDWPAGHPPITNDLLLLNHLDLRVPGTFIRLASRSPAAAGRRRVPQAECPPHTLYGRGT
jgi:hypothetical protein